MVETIIVPLHISGIWIPQYSDDYFATGSRGAGINISLYLYAKPVDGGCKAVLNGARVLDAQSREICSASADIGVEAKAPFNLGSGFGISAALLISHSILANLHVNKPILQALQRAHLLEVKYRTGLGDVISEYLGGFVVRVRPGAPGIGEAYRILVKYPVTLVVSELNTFEPTPTMLSRLSREVIDEGEKLLERVLELQDLHTFFECANTFTRKLFDYAIADNIVQGVKGIVGFYRKKSALVLWVEREYVNDIVEKLHSFGLKAFVTTISPTGVQIVATP
jgi:pantoate kinase